MAINHSALLLIYSLIPAREAGSAGSAGSAGEVSIEIILDVVTFPPMARKALSRFAAETLSLLSQDPLIEEDFRAFADVAA